MARTQEAAVIAAERQRFQYFASWHGRKPGGDTYINMLGGHYTMAPGLCRTRATSPHWRLMLFHSPVELHLIGGAVVEVPAESLVLWQDHIAPEAYGHQRNTWSHSWISCGGRHIAALLAESGLQPLHPAQLPGPAVADRTLLGLHHELTAHATADNAIIEAWLRLLLCEARRGASGASTAADPDGLLWVRRRLDKELDRTVSLEALARERGMSSRHLVRRFTETWGLTPAAYHLRARMAYACSLLDQRDAPLTGIAHSVGYADAFAFSKAFKRHHGISPVDYRTKPPR